MMRRVLIALIVAGAALAAYAPAASAAVQDDAKVIVCKYIANENAPGGEVFGQVIDVSANALEGEGFTGTFPFEFEDQQGKSVAVRFATGPGDKGNEVTDCGQPTSPPPPPPPPTTPPPAPRVVCQPGAKVGPWYGDPRINITLTGPGTFRITGGVQRFSGLRTITVAVSCGATYTVGRYKILEGHALRVYLNGTLILQKFAPSVQSLR